MTRLPYRATTFTAVFLLNTLKLANAQPTEMAILAGSVVADLDGERVVLATLESAYHVEVHGDVVNVRVLQRFANPFNKPMNARYLFPLNSRAAVHAMTMRVGDEVIVATIQEVRKAKRTFAEARRSGKAAALLEQHRPNMFTQRLANLMPGMPIEVEIEYTHTVPKVDGAYELVVPMVVGPRFQPEGSGVAPTDFRSHGDDTPAPSTGTWQLEALPEYPPTAGVNLPASIESERVSLRLDLEAPMAIQDAGSSTHDLAVVVQSPTRRTMTFAAGRVIDNRDFVLRYTFSAEETTAGVLTHWEVGEGGYFSLLIEPPEQVSEAAVIPREMVFLLDCSGSMRGTPINASKAFMVKALKNLRPTDTFRIIRFSDSATEFSTHPLLATPLNIARGLRYTGSLSGSGGTRMISGVSQALSAPIPSGAIRNVIFLTDGYIGNEIEVMRVVQASKGEARLFTFGVGTGVNRYLLNELARVGRGFARYFDPVTDDETLDAVASELAEKLHTPVLTDIFIDWNDLPVSDVSPARIPDLYAGETIRLTGRFDKPANGVLNIIGRSAQRRASLSSAVSLDTAVRPGLRQIWARRAVADQMHEFVMPQALRPGNATDQELQNAITDLGLTYGLATRWTAFVSVSRKRYNKRPGDALDADVALPKVAGVSNSAYPQSTFTGYGAPEPGEWLGLGVGLLTLLLFRRRLRATNGNALT